MTQRSTGTKPPSDEEGPSQWMERVPPFMIFLYVGGCVWAWALLAIWWWFR
jgi:hypothetical protein